MKQCKLENNKDTVRERYSMIFDIVALLIVKETANNDDGRKAMQAGGIGRILKNTRKILKIQKNTEKW